MVHLLYPLPGGAVPLIMGLLHVITIAGWWFQTFGLFCIMGLSFPLTNSYFSRWLLHHQPGVITIVIPLYPWPAPPTSFMVTHTFVEWLCISYTVGSRFRKDGFIGGGTSQMVIMALRFDI